MSGDCTGVIEKGDGLSNSGGIDAVSSFAALASLLEISERNVDVCDDSVELRGTPWMISLTELCSCRRVTCNVRRIANFSDNDFGFDLNTDGFEWTDVMHDVSIPIEGLHINCDSAPVLDVAR
jgi:hypothetical protein